MSQEKEQAARYCVPYVRLFPIWNYGPRYALLTGEYVGDGWYPERYGQWTYRTKAEAEAKHGGGGPKR